MTIYNKKHCRIYYNKTLKTVIQKWKGYADYDDFVEAIDATILFFQYENAKYIISDILDAKQATQESVDYTTNIANPILVENGLIAIIFVAKNIGSAKNSLNQFKYGSHDLLVGEVFNIDNAIKKIKELESKNV